MIIRLEWNVCYVIQLPDVAANEDDVLNVITIINLSDSQMI